MLSQVFSQDQPLIAHFNNVIASKKQPANHFDNNIISDAHIHKILSKAPLPRQADDAGLNLFRQIF